MVRTLGFCGICRRPCGAMAVWCADCWLLIPPSIRAHIDETFERSRRLGRRLPEYDQAVDEVESWLDLRCELFPNAYVCRVHRVGLSMEARGLFDNRQEVTNEH